MASGVWCKGPGAAPGSRPMRSASGLHAPSRLRWACAGGSIPLSSVWRSRRTVVLAGGRGSELPLDTDAVTCPEDNPDFDDLKLDRALYDELGISPEEVMEQRQMTDAELVDPEGYDLGFDDEDMLSQDALDLRLDEVDKSVYGPEAVLLAGFRPDEVTMTRAVLDGAGGAAIKVLACTDDVLYGTLDEAIYAQEIDWSQPRPSSWDRPSAWGSQKAVLFSGMGVKAQATVLELLDSANICNICAYMALEADCTRRVGDVLADAVKSNRSHSSSSKSASAVEDKFKDRMVSSRGFGDLQQLLGEKARMRVRSVSQDAVPDDGETGNGCDLTESELDQLFESFTLGEGKGGEVSASGSATTSPSADSVLVDIAVNAAGSSAAVGDAGGEEDAQSRFLKRMIASRQSRRSSAMRSSNDGGTDKAVPESAAGSVESDLEQDLMSLADFEDVLDDLLPAGTASPAAPVAPSKEPAASKLSPASPHAAAASSSFLARIQAAVQEGADAATLEGILSEFEDSSPDEGAQPTLEEPPVSLRGSGGNTRSQAPLRPGSSLPAGPERPPSVVKDDPFLNVRPEVRRALEGKNVQFVDMSKLPKKYRDRVVGQLKSRQEQAQEEQQEVQEQLAMLESQKQGRQEAGLMMPSQSAPGGGDFAIPPGWEVSAGDQEADGLLDGDEDMQEYEDEDQQDVAMDADLVMRLKDAAIASGLNPERALAEAIALGVHVPEAAVHAAGLNMPNEEIVAEIRREYALASDDVDEGGSEGAASFPSVPGPSPEVRFTNAPDPGSWSNEQPGNGGGSAGMQQPAGPHPARRWGEGLMKGAKKKQGRKEDA